MTRLSLTLTPVIIIGVAILLAVLNLATPASSALHVSDFVVGQTINTDGGTGAAGGWYPTTHRPNRRWTNRPVDA